MIGRGSVPASTTAPAAPSATASSSAAASVFHSQDDQNDHDEGDDDDGVYEVPVFGRISHAPQQCQRGQPNQCRAGQKRLWNNKVGVPVDALKSNRLKP